MSNGNGKNSKDDLLAGIPHERSEPRPDFSTPPLRKKLPRELQDTLDNDEKLWDVLYEGKSEDSTDTNLRYAAYASRVRTILLSAQRYVAYTSDIGESFRPVAHPYLVKGAYAVSWLYLTGDVAHEGYKAYLRNQRTRYPHLTTEDENVTGSDKHSSLTSAVKKLGAGITSREGGKDTKGKDVADAAPVSVHIPAIEDYRAVMAQRAVFQSVASMGLPAFTIHSIVKYSGKALKDVKNKTMRTWGPIGLGLSIVPFLPFVFDEPVEKATEWVFYNAFKAVGGEDAVEGRPVTGNKQLRYQESRSGAVKEKEL